MSRLLTLLLLYRNGFDAGKYISFEQRINADKAAYYAALRDSSAGWQTNENNPFPFMLNFLMTLYGYYEELDRRFAVASTGRVTKSAGCAGPPPLQKIVWKKFAFSVAL